MFQEEYVTGTNITVDNFDISEVLAAFQHLVEDGELLLNGPGPLCLSAVLCDVEKVGVGAFEKEY